MAAQSNQAQEFFWKLSKRNKSSIILSIKIGRYQSGIPGHVFGNGSIVETLTKRYPSILFRIHIKAAERPDSWYDAVNTTQDFKMGNLGGTNNRKGVPPRGEYDIWAMKMEHYLAHIDYPFWEVIQNGNGFVSITTDTQGQIKVLPPRSAEEILARERERKARTTLLMALPEDHLAKFHKMTDAKEMWDAIKSRFGGNDESKKMQKFQSLLSQLEIHGAGVSTEDANQKFLRSLPSAWSQVSLIMRTKPGVDSLSFDDLYNNLRVFENDYNSQYEQTSSYSLLANQSSCPQLDHEDLEQLDEFDLEEMGLKCRRATQLPQDGHFARECRTKGNQDSRRRDAWNSRNKDKENGRRSGKQEDSKALVTIDGEGVDWTSHSKEEEDYALMACNSSGSDTESKEKEDLKAKVEKWHNSSKNLGKLLNTQMSANDKFGLGYGDHRYDGILSYENEVLQSVFMNKESELEKQPLYDRDCDFHEKRMAKQAELNNRMKRNSSQREIRPIWNNVQRVNHMNQFVPTAVLTRTGKIQFNTARASLLVLLGEKGKLLLSPQQVVIGDNKDTTGTKSPNTMVDQDYPYRALQKHKGLLIVDVSGSWTGNKDTLLEYHDLMICDKKNKVLFTDSECLVLSPEFKLPDANQVLLRIPRQNNMYSFNLENIVPSGGLACLIAKAIIDESTKLA
ncbi:hypothetical protein Tco_1245301 [Tanacetum coccineum]